jgi:hypothetical protein
VTLVTKAELAAGSAELWAEWLRSAIRAYTAPVASHRRVRAFAPLDVDPDSSSPAGEIFEQIWKLVLTANSAPANAAVEVLRTWDPALDGWRPAALILQLATRLAGRNLYRATLSLLAKSVALPSNAKRELAYLAVLAAGARFRRSEVEELSRALWRMDLMEPELAGALALILARPDFGGLEELPRKVIAFLPGLAAEPQDLRYVQAIAAKLPKEFTSDELVRGLEPTPGDDDMEADLRRMLARITVPWALARTATGRPQSTAREADWEKEFAERVNTLDQLGDQVREGNVVRFPGSPSKQGNRDR